MSPDFTTKVKLSYRIFHVLNLIGRPLSPAKYKPSEVALLSRPPTIGASKVRQTPTYESHIFTRHDYTETRPAQTPVKFLS